MNAVIAALYMIRLYHTVVMARRASSVNIPNKLLTRRGPTRGLESELTYAFGVFKSIIFHHEVTSAGVTSMVNRARGKFPLCQDKHNTRAFFGLFAMLRSL